MSRYVVEAQRTVYARRSLGVSLCQTDRQGFAWIVAGPMVLCVETTEFRVSENQVVLQGNDKGLVRAGSRRRKVAVVVLVGVSLIAAGGFAYIHAMSQQVADDPMATIRPNGSLCRDYAQWSADTGQKDARMEKYCKQP